MWSKLRKVLTAPFRWLKDATIWMAQPPIKEDGLMSRTRNKVRQHPIISTTLLFGATLVTSYLTGIWWLGAGLFLLGIMLFSGTSILTGFMRVTGIASEVAFALVLLAALVAIHTPIPSLWLAYLCVPIALILLKIIREGLTFATLTVEMGSPEEFEHVIAS